MSSKSSTWCGSLFLTRLLTRSGLGSLTAVRVLLSLGRLRAVANSAGVVTLL